ncbi:MAG: insulinase family protein [Calditrichia bacterium]|nr:insulinase family protein [Calditrichia bacterium]
MVSSDQSIYEKTILDNGISIISERIDSVRSVSIGIWVKTGSRAENVSENGIAHFLEHMVFKGTKKRSPLKIAQSMEFLGGSLNAFTGKEVTCFFANALDTHLKNAVEILADIVCNSTFPQKEINREKQVVLEEIKSIKDTPEEYVFDIFHEKLFPNSSLGRPILGSEKIIDSMDRSRVLSFWNDNYFGQNIIVSAAGRLNHSNLVKLVDKYFSFSNGTHTRPVETAKSASSKAYYLDQPISQAHLCTGGESISYKSEDRFSLMILNTYLGGGMSSRLFQQVREKRGLAYSVYSFLDFYSDVGLFGIYAGTDHQKLDIIQSLLKDELHRVSIKPLKKNTLSKLKNQLKGNLVLTLESSSRRMSRLAKNEIYFGEYVSLDKLIKGIDQVQQEDIISIAQKVFRPDDFITVILNPSN